VDWEDVDGEGWAVGGEEEEGLGGCFWEEVSFFGSFFIYFFHKFFFCVLGIGGVDCVFFFRLGFEWVRRCIILRRRGLRILRL
jgi:hypothetical protein